MAGGGEFARMAGMSYAAAVAQLYALGHELVPAGGSVPRRKFDLAHMRTLAASLGDPERRFPSVLIAGTNGKGSTAATLAAILASAGYRTGLYTSPHLVKVNERIQMSVPTMPSEYASMDSPISAGPSLLMPIGDEEFARHYFRVDTAAKRLVQSEALPFMPSFFETLTAVAFEYFAERHADIVVLEVGLGGRLDATNIVEPVLSVITDIALDHQEYLGSTIAEIAREKAGILRAGGTLITLPQHPEANRVFGEVAAELPGLKAISAGDYVPPAVPSGGSGGVGMENRYTLSLEGESISVRSPLRGQHQQRNVALAIAAAVELRNAKGYNIHNTAIERGIEETLWPGRLQFVPLEDGRMLLLDVAHNPAGAWTLRAALSQMPSDRPRTLIFSCLRDKNVEEMTQMLFPFFDSTSGEVEREGDHIIVAAIDSPRAAPVEDLLAAAQRLNIPAHAAPHLTAAFAQACEITPAGGLIVATGSTYVVGDVLRLVQERV